MYRKRGICESTVLQAQRSRMQILLDPPTPRLIMNKKNKIASSEFKINIDNNLRKNSKILSKNEHEDILEKFKKYGVLSFSNISSNIENLTKFIDLFSQSYAHDAQRRNIRFNNRNIRNVDTGYQKILLHSETSFSPSRPEIIWFYCVSPPKTSSGKTIINIKPIICKTMNCIIPI